MASLSLCSTFNHDNANLNLVLLIVYIVNLFFYEPSYFQLLYLMRLSLVLQVILNIFLVYTRSNYSCSNERVFFLLVIHTISSYSTQISTAYHLFWLLHTTNIFAENIVILGLLIFQEL